MTKIGEHVASQAFDPNAKMVINSSNNIFLGRAVSDPFSKRVDLCVINDQLVITYPGGDTIEIPLEDVAKAMGM